MPLPAGSALGSTQAWSLLCEGEVTPQRAKDLPPGALLSLFCPGGLGQVEASSGKWGSHTLLSEDEKLNQIIY